MDKWGFVIDDSSSDGAAMASHRTEVKVCGCCRIRLPMLTCISPLQESKKSREKETLRAEKWATILNQWSIMSDEKKRKMKQKFRKGIPDRLRGAMWKKLCKGMFVVVAAAPM